MQNFKKRYALGLSGVLAVCAGSLGTSYAADDGSAGVSTLGAPTSVVEAHALSVPDSSVTAVVRELLREAQNGNQFPQQRAFPLQEFFGFSAAVED